jgi:hypothetical protein
MKTLLAAALLTLLTAAGASADDQPGKKPGQRSGGQGKPGGGMMLVQLFQRADTNGDGKVSLDEFKKALASAPNSRMKDNAEKIFKRFDSNGDGFVTKDELKKAMETMQARRNGGGKPGGKKPG